jgi:hypothetical protein
MLLDSVRETTLTPTRSYMMKVKSLLRAVKILITYWVAKAWRILHEQHKDPIIHTFCDYSISLNLGGSQDSAEDVGYS